jgi:hypothetical protein
MKTMERQVANPLMTRSGRLASGALGAVILALLAVLGMAALGITSREAIGGSGATLDVDQALVEFRRNERQERYGFSPAEVRETLIDVRKDEREER